MLLLLLLLLLMLLLLLLLLLLLYPLRYPLGVPGGLLVEEVESPSEADENMFGLLDPFEWVLPTSSNSPSVLAKEADRERIGVAFLVGTVY
jgi:hypothetical protein